MSLRRTALIWSSVTSCPQVDGVQKKTFVSSFSSCFLPKSFAQEPRAMQSPSRNIPIRTVIVAATVVERFAPSERIDSEKSSLEPHSDA